MEINAIIDKNVIDKNVIDNKILYFFLKFCLLRHHFQKCCMNIDIFEKIVNCRNFKRCKNF